MQKELRKNEVPYSRGDGYLSELLEQDSQGGISSPTWRGLLIAVIAAIVLSVTATLLLGGSFGYERRDSAGDFGAGSECCAPAAEK